MEPVINGIASTIQLLDVLVEEIVTCMFNEIFVPYVRST